MKTALLYKLIFAIVFLPLYSLGSTIGKEKHEKSKTIKKEFKVNSNALVKVDNSYGNLDVVTWNENRVVFEITITTSGNKVDKVTEKLDDITVEFESSMDKVSAKTIFNKKKSGNWWNWNNNNKVNMKINYIVKIPITNSVDLSNDYGNINLDKLEGVAKINCDYGKITTKELMADNNILNFDYTNNSYFEYINSASINADYSGYTVSKSKNLKVNADYTQSKIETTENIEFNCDYGGMTIENANNIKGNGDYLTTVIGNVYKNVSLRADYGSIKIKRMNSNAGNVDISSDYVGIKIGVTSGYDFNFDINLEYASLKDLDGFQYSKKKIESSDKYYSGYYGNSNSNNLIKISSDYGSVTFYNN